MSEKDVQRMREVFERTARNMTDAGVRTDPPSRNNWEITKYRFTLGRGGHDYSACGDQSDYMQSVFEGLPHLDDGWTFESQGAVFLDPTDERFPIHYWFEGRSDNPTDPIVVVDPWMNKLDSHPVPATTPTPTPPEDVAGATAIGAALGGIAAGGVHIGGQGHADSNYRGGTICWCGKDHGPHNYLGGTTCWCGKYNDYIGIPR